MLTLPKLIAHRGANQIAPENTLIAFELAKQHGAKMLEFDVVLSQDHIPVIIHDETVTRTTNGRGFVWDHSLQALQQLDAGSWFDPQFQGTTIPTLQETLQQLQEWGMAANIEIKDTGDVARNAMTAQAAAPIIADFATTTPCIVSSCCYQTATLVRYLLPTMPIGMLLHLKSWQHLQGQQLAVIQDRYQQLDCTALHINDADITEQCVSQLKAFAPQLAVFTVNTLERARLLFAWGVDSIFTDNIDILY